MKHIIHSLIIFAFFLPVNNFAIQKIQQSKTQQVQGEQITSPQVTTFSISGKVTQQNDGKPIADMRIELFDENWQFFFDKVNVTNAEGKYTISDLAPGSYYLLVRGVTLDKFGRYKTIYFEEYYKESKDQAGALLVNLSGNLIDIDFTLEGACISGTVYHQATGLPIVNMFVNLFDSSWNEITQNYPHYPVTNLNGRYYFGKLPPGFYYVKAEGYTSDFKSYIPEYYKESRDQAGAMKLNLICGDTTNINFTIEDWRCIAGKVTRQDNGAPIDSIHVLLFNSNWDLVHWCETGSNGQYLFDMVYPGAYYIGIEGYGIFDGKYQKRYLQEYYQESPTREGATFLNVEKDVTKIDFTLEEGGSISGQVTRQDNGAPIDSVRISLFNHDWSFIREEISNTNGFYSYSGIDQGSYYVEATGLVRS